MQGIKSGGYLFVTLEHLITMLTELEIVPWIYPQYITYRVTVHMLLLQLVLFRASLIKLIKQILTICG